MLRSVLRELVGAVELRHPAHDCCYLELALTRRTTVVTADRRFRSLADRMSAAEIRAAHPHLAADYLRREEIIFGEPGIAA